MKIIWQKNKIFKQEFIIIGNWNFSTCEKFSKCKYISADTETKLYYKDELLTEEKAQLLYIRYGAKWCRMNIVVKAYAFMLSDGENFALFQNIEDFLLCCATMHVDKIFWYNTRFDFALFDYYFETNNWKTTEFVIEKLHGDRKRFPKNTYQSLNGDYGQRYQMRLWVEYKNSSYHRKVHNFKMIDICNIFAGGLKRNLIDWGITDKENKEVRKLQMDYVNASIENDIDYLIADTKGLHLLAEKINEKVKEISGFSLFDGDYITAGGLAKKSMLSFMFNKKKLSDNMQFFRKYFPMSVEKDNEYREFKLYQGGKCFVSPYKVGKIINNIYKYDINSMYPTQMRNMLYPIGNGIVVNKIKNDKYKIYVLKIKNIIGVLKENMVPTWYDIITKEYTERIFEEEEQYFWLEELNELENYYHLSYDIIEIREFEGKYCSGMRKYVDHYYDIKKNSKGAIKQGAKLFLNSGYGKLSQRIERVQCDYKLCEEGYIHLVKSNEEIDEKSMMSVLVGSRITALSRVLLMYYIRTICKNNPKKYFVYCDTDSVHALCDYKDTDDKELGKMKNEGIYEYGKYLAPKTYMLYNNIVDNDKEFEIHTKGVNTNVVKNIIEKDFEEHKDIERVFNEYFKAGITYKCLTALNCIGGRALIYIDKMLLNPIREKEIIEDDERID